MSPGGTAVRSLTSERKKGPWRQDQGVNPGQAAAAHSSAGCITGGHR